LKHQAHGSIPPLCAPGARHRFGASRALTLGAAARATGKSKAAIARAVKSGRPSQMVEKFLTKIDPQPWRQMLSAAALDA
jgi:hypothetical protein